MFKKNICYNHEHYPVMLNKIIKALNINNKRKNGNYLDCTFGTGAHTFKILKHLNNNGKLISIDLDNYSIEKNIILDNRLILYNEDFINLDNIINKIKIKFDGILIDLGISSQQIYNNKKGFCYSINNKLDMRINNSLNFNLIEWLNSASLNEIYNNIKNLSNDTNFIYCISKNIIKFRNNTPIINSKNLLDIILSSKNNKYKIHKIIPKIFNIFKMFVNKELYKLSIILKKSFNNLNKNGRLVIISFNSFEDKIIKKFILNNINKIKLNFKYIPEKKEIYLNPKSKSAILRFIEKK